MKTNRIKNAFFRVKDSGRKSALIPYITVGDPSVNITVPLMHSLVKSGADIIELGIPFSDPMADGPVIQKSSERSIAKGVGIMDVLSAVEKFRNDDTKTPIVLMGYENPIECIGQENFVNLAKNSGVDGVLVVDSPPEESYYFSDLLKKNDMHQIFLLSPTSTEERIKFISEIASGYIYYVSLKGVTGSSKLDVSDVNKRLETIRKYINIPVGVGFGVRDADTARRIAILSDAIVIGSKIIELMEQAFNDAKIGEKEECAIEAAVNFISTINNVLK
ncbi:tryptophan synthase alpha chain [Candidatus Kinetoplastibacterium blastocrithidii TCC012E]|uniref:Tryptophan synthase alpha chain n=1 Tax=Candidatus Kinetoplastidibacterium blastocrithidiae TCC012E TaxID=1208922 RepID=M1MDU7_9PROT|nr:tryptophan synthase subunit alpha [Candidatus Kinetoplastibacterium blastocrithidii]AFZ83775.1 tryptophan synthase subunit alpha 1 [Candidatus Kinetoplastibacterium blastocrithidii (ex Strigomonas culicis)]AGF49900.1 tryptophan synthase alpha chain [Candidatus Kinetoplastibacterium blastocrithidii TCC012E]